MPLTKLDVLIIGSGFAGLCMAIKLKEAGLESFLVLEKESDVGGTWRDNTYPGCGCDIPSHFYSFSFDLNPDWSRTYPTQPEVWKYLQTTAVKHGVLTHIQFDSEVREAVFDEQSHVWRVQTAAGEIYHSRVVVSGMGGLSRPAYPDIEGLQTFRGASFHSGRWEHEVDLRGKRVAVIGTGSSAVQFVPRIAPEVDQLYVFQRTPPWILPRLDRRIPSWQRFLFRNVPGLMRAFRYGLYWAQESLGFGYTVSQKPLAILEAVARWRLRRAISDPTLRARLTPDYVLGCKRTVISNDYLPTLERPNVELVTERISKILDDSVVTSDGTVREVDVLIFGTGFRTMDLLSPVRFLGRGGIALNDVWDAEAPEAYFGVVVHGYPNLFFIIGPNSRVAPGSIVFMIEAQVHYIMKGLEYMRESGLVAMEVQPAAQTDYNRALQKRMRRTVFVTGCESWYRTSRGENPILWPGFSFSYWIRSRRVNTSAYRVTYERTSRAGP